MLILSIICSVVLAMFTLLAAIFDDDSPGIQATWTFLFILQGIPLAFLIVLALNN